MLAIKWALDTLTYYLIGKEFVLETDYCALQWIDNMKDINARITRWYMSLQPYIVFKSSIDQDKRTSLLTFCAITLMSNCDIGGWGEGA